MYYNQYHEKHQGATYTSKEVKYIFAAAIPANKSGRMKYKYIPNLTPAQIIKEKEHKANQEALTHRWWCVDNDIIIKKINRKFGGKIEGRSKTTSSIYSYLPTKKVRVRVSKHHIFVKRSEADISIFLKEKEFFINEKIYDIPVKLTSKEVESNIAKEAILFINQNILS